MMFPCQFSSYLHIYIYIYFEVQQVKRTIDNYHLIVQERNIEVESRVKMQPVKLVGAHEDEENQEYKENLNYMT
jgi:hypothetical protein